MEVSITAPVAEANRIDVVTFLRAEGYTQHIQAADEIVAGWIGSEVVGAVRLATEQGVTVLRGMRVRHDMQRQGIGLRLLEALAAMLGRRNCYCIPYSWLLGFYGRIGFEEARPDQVPAFLAERHARYTERGLSVSLMVRNTEIGV